MANKSKMKELKTIVREKYGQIAKQSKLQNQTSCCGVGASCYEPGDTEKMIESSVFADDYSNLKGYNEAADLGLGCGLPTEFAKIQKGQTVVDLGSGAGNDCFVARAETGETGRVIGLDFTPEMIDKARTNAKKLGFSNVRFIYGDIEAIPLEDNVADVVVSNCVMNLVPSKEKAYAETYRILKPGGHFSISDIVIEGELPEELKKAAEMYAGCVSGAIQKDDYLSIITKSGFKNMEVQKKKPIVLPTEILETYLDTDGLAAFNKAQGIYSITVYAEK